MNFSFSQADLINKLKQIRTAFLLHQDLYLSFNHSRGSQPPAAGFKQLSAAHFGLPSAAENLEKTMKYAWSWDITPMSTFWTTIISAKTLLTTLCQAMTLIFQMFLLTVVCLVLSHVFQNAFWVIFLLKSAQLCSWCRLDNVGGASIHPGTLCVLGEMHTWYWNSIGLRLITLIKYARMDKYAYWETATDYVGGGGTLTPSLVTCYSIYIYIYILFVLFLSVDIRPSEREILFQSLCQSRTSKKIAK